MAVLMQLDLRFTQLGDDLFRNDLLLPSRHRTPSFDYVRMT
jgi:hypothetical protein